MGLSKAVGQTNLVLLSRIFCSGVSQEQHLLENLRSGQLRQTVGLFQSALSEPQSFNEIMTSFGLQPSPTSNAPFGAQVRLRIVCRAGRTQGAYIKGPLPPPPCVSMAQTMRSRKGVGLCGLLRWALDGYSLVSQPREASLHDLLASEFLSFFIWPRGKKPAVSRGRLMWLSQ